jgi:hypothetical protein
MWWGVADFVVAFELNLAVPAAAELVRMNVGWWLAASLWIC